jgi:hypothetical protein
MPRKKANIHYLYKTTCLITSKYYIGIHSTANLEDGYMGSGKRLRYSLRKYGKENHIKEIIEFFDSRELLIEAEKSAITSDTLNDVMCMNLKEGGSGGFMNLDHQRKAQNSGGESFKKKLQNDEKFREFWKNKASEHLKILHRDKKIKYDTFTGKKHSDETKKKMSESSKGMGVGENNSQYGTIWITNGVDNKKIKKQNFIPEGWYKGRI